MPIDPYKELGLERDATPEQIKKAHRNMAKKYHPDMSGGNTEQFDIIQQSYVVLADPEKKEHYDRTGEFKLGDTQSKAAAILANFLAEAIEMDVPMFVDWIGVLKGFIGKKSDAIQEKVNKAEQTLKKVNKLRRKMKRKKKGVGLFEAVIDGKIAKEMEHIAEGKRMLGDFRLAIEALDEYEFEKDPKPAVEPQDDVREHFVNFFKFATTMKTGE